MITGVFMIYKIVFSLHLFHIIMPSPTPESNSRPYYHKSLPAPTKKEPLHKRLFRFIIIRQ